MEYPFFMYKPKKIPIACLGKKLAFQRENYDYIGLEYPEYM